MVGSLGLFILLGSFVIQSRIRSKSANQVDVAQRRPKVLWQHVSPVDEVMARRASAETELERALQNIERLKKELDHTQLEIERLQEAVLLNSRQEFERLQEAVNQAVSRLDHARDSLSGREKEVHSLLRGLRELLATAGKTVDRSP